MARPGSFLRLDRHERDRVTGAQESHRNRGRIRKPVRQQVEKLLEELRAHGAETGRQIEDAVSADHRGKHVVEAVGGQAPDVGVRAGIPRADRHVVTLVEFPDQGRDIFGLVLTIAVHHYEDVATCRPGAALNCRTVSQ